MAVESKPLHLPSAAEALPKHWRWQRLDEVCEGVFDCPHSTPALTNDGPFVVRSQDVRSGIFRMESAGCVSDETYQERIARAEPRHGDLVYSREGTYFGIAAELPPGVRVCLGQRMVLLRPDTHKANFRFLRYWLNSPAMAAHIHGFRDGTVAERLNMPIIRGLPVAIPPLSEQRAIAAVLGSLDDKIELNRRMNETLEALAQSLFKSWFVDATQSALPKGWRESTVDEEFNLTMGQSPPGESYNETGDGIPFYQGRTDFGFRFPMARVYCTAPTRFANAGDTLVSVRAPVGSVNMATEKCSVGRGVAAVRHKSGSRSYSYYFMRSLEADFACFEAEGTVFGSINKADFHAIKRAAPPSEVVEAFEKMVFPMDQRIENNEKESRTLASLRDSLLPKLMRGEVRVKDVEQEL